MADLLSKPQRPERRRDPSSALLDGVNDIDLKPWARVPRMAGDPNYFGRNLPQWREHNREVENQINRLARSGQWGLVENILEDEGYKFDEFEKQLYALEQAVDRGKRGRLRQDMYDVSQAAADEQVSVGLLKAMGFSDAQIRNNNPLLGTDLSGTFGGHGYGIDAQQRLARTGNLSLGVTQFTPGLIDEYLRKGDVPLGELITAYRRRTGRVTEGKLLQTMDTSINPTNLRSREFAENPEAYHKDLLISNARPGKKVKQLHDRELPTSTAIIDLNKARDLILPLTGDQARARRMRFNENDNGSVSLIVPRGVFTDQMAGPGDTSGINRILANKQAVLAAGSAPPRRRRR